MLQPRQILPVRRVLRLPLIVDVGQEVTRLEIAIQLRRVAEVLRGHEPALHEGGPGPGAEQRVRALAHEVGSGGAGLELRDAVVLGAKGEEGAHGRVVAALDVAAQELAALAEAEGVDGGRSAEDGVGEELVAHELDLFCDVAEEGGAAVGRARVCQVDDVDICAWVDGVGQFCHFFEAVGVEAVAEAVPDYEGEGRVVVFVIIGGGGWGEGERWRWWLG